MALELFVACCVGLYNHFKILTVGFFLFISLLNLRNVILINQNVCFITGIVLNCKDVSRYKGVALRHVNLSNNAVNCGINNVIIEAVN